MYKRSYRIKVTLREILVSVVVILLMISIGFFVSNSIHNSVSEHNEKYFKALKIDNNKEMFNYAVKTNIGNTLTYGSLSANEPVSDKLIDGKYFYIEKIKEIYTMHTRTVSYKCGKSTCTRTETYWTWDFAGLDEYNTTTFKFMGNDYDYDLIQLNNSEHLDTVKNGHVRYIFNVIPKEFNGTLFSFIKNNELTENNLFANKSIAQVMEKKEKEADEGSILFWVLWGVLTIVIVVVFVLMDNKYLNNLK